MQREREDTEGTNARTHLRQEETCECYVHKNAFIHRLSKNTTNKPVPVEAVGYKNRESKVSTTTTRNSVSVPSVAYACGFGYSSFFLFSNQRPRSVSNTSLHKEVKNSLKTPPPSIPALETIQNPLDIRDDNRKGSHWEKKIEGISGSYANEDEGLRVSIRKQGYRRIESEENEHSLFLPKLINKRNLNRRLQIHLPEPVKAVLSNHSPAHLHPLPSITPQAPEKHRVLAISRHHIVHDEIPKDRDTCFEGNGEGDVVEYPEAWRHAGNLPF